MITTIVTGVLVVVLVFLMCAAYIDSMNTELKTLKEHVSSERDAMRREAQLVADEARKIAVNAKGIASNALSSAQRAEDKVLKHIASVNDQISEVINSVNK